MSSPVAPHDESPAAPRHMDSAAWMLFATGMAQVAVAAYVMVDLSLRIPPAAADSMKTLLYSGGLFVLTGAGAKTDALDRLKAILGK
jgi:hypothetical protein